MKRGFQMLNEISYVTAAQEINWGLVGSTVVTGLVVVFLILAILVLFLWAFGRIFKAIGSAGEKRERKKLEQQAVHIQNSKPAAPETAPKTEQSPSEQDEDDYYDEDDDEIIAVIAAAIAAYGASEGKQYRIAGIRRKKTSRSGWSSAGIAENMRGFME